MTTWRRLRNLWRSLSHARDLIRETVGVDPVIATLGGVYWTVLVTRLLVLLIPLTDLAQGWLVGAFVGLLVGEVMFRPKKGRVGNPPGHGLRRLADFFCNRKTMQLVFEPLLADMRIEYFDALEAGRPWKARWMQVLYTIHFLRAAGLHRFFSLMSSLLKVKAR